MSKELLKLTEEWYGEIQKCSQEMAVAEIDMRALHDESREILREKQLRRRSGVGTSTEYIRWGGAGETSERIGKGEEEKKSEVEWDGPFRLGKDCQDIDGWVERIFSESRRSEGIREGDSRDSEGDTRQVEDTRRGHEAAERIDRLVDEALFGDLDESSERVLAGVGLSAYGRYLQRESARITDCSTSTGLGCGAPRGCRRGLGRFAGEVNPVVGWVYTAMAALVLVIAVALITGFSG